MPVSLHFIIDYLRNNLSLELLVGGSQSRDRFTF